MRCTVDRDHLFNAVQFASQFSPAKSHKDVLTYTKLAVISDTRMVISTFDGEAQAEVDVDCNSTDLFQVLVNTQMLLKLLKNCDDEYLELDVDNLVDPSCLGIGNHDDRYELVVLNGDLPPLPSAQQRHLTLPNGLLTRANCLSVATDLESSRYALGGVLFHVNGDGMHLCGTDGRRLMYYHTPVNAGAEWQCIIPTEVVKRIADLDGSDVELHVNENFVVISTPKYRVAARLVDGRFPNYMKVMEESEPASARRTIDRELLLASLRRAMLVSSEESRGAEWAGDCNTLTLKASTVGIGKSKVSLQCEGESTDEFKVTLDSRLIVQMIERLKSNTVDVKFHGEQGSVHVICDGVTCVIMPMSR